jgi:cell division protein FtsX
MLKAVVIVMFIACLVAFAVMAYRAFKHKVNFKVLTDAEVKIATEAKKVEAEAKKVEGEVVTEVKKL